MILWDPLVEFLQSMIFVCAQAFGGNLGAGVLVASIVVRIALFPFTLRLARLSMAHQQAMGRLQPELDRIRKKFAKNPERMAADSNAIFKKNGISPFPMTGCLGALAQTPVFLAVYSAIRNVVAAGGSFLWIKNLAKPDALLTIGVAALTYLSVAISTSVATPQTGKPVLLVLPVALTIVVLAKTSAGVGLYWGVSAVANTLQAYIIRRSPPLGHTP